jgi:hypothetical protein
MSSTATALATHLALANAGFDDRLLADAAHELDRRFGTCHATIQVWAGRAERHLAPAHVVSLDVSFRRIHCRRRAITLVDASQRRGGSIRTEAVTCFRGPRVLASSYQSTLAL